MLRKIRLYGSLAKFVGTRVLEADVRTAAEAVRFLVTNFDGLEQHMADKHYKVITHTAITLDELHDITNVDTIKIVPAVEGSGPVGRILAGIGLVVLSFFVPFAAPLLLGIGASLVLGGVAQLLTPVPRLGQGEGSTTDTKRSYNFSGIQQTSRAGTPVPLVYGKTLVGSVVISAGVSDEVKTGEAVILDSPTDTNRLLPGGCDGAGGVKLIKWYKNGVHLSTHDYTAGSPPVLTYHTGDIRPSWENENTAIIIMTPGDVGATYMSIVECFNGSINRYIKVVGENDWIRPAPPGYMWWYQMEYYYVKCQGAPGQGTFIAGPGAGGYGAPLWIVNDPSASAAVCGESETLRLLIAGLTPGQIPLCAPPTFAGLTYNNIGSFGDMFTIKRAVRTVATLVEVGICS
jgi:predicted phage tail protein